MAAEPSASQRIALGTLARSTGEVVAKVASVAFYIAIARELGEGSFGTFFFGLSLSQLVLMIAGLGTDEYVTRELARDPRTYDDLFPQVIAVKGGLLAALWFVVGLIVLAAGYEGEAVLAIMLIGAGVAVEYQTKTLFAVFQARERQRYIAAVLVLQRTLTAIGGIAALVAGAGLVTVSVIFLAGAVVGLGFSYLILLGHFERARGRIRPSTWGPILKRSAPLGLVVVLYLALIRLDATLLGFLADDIEVGEYGAAYRLVDATMFVSWAFGAAVMPWFSREGDRPVGGVSMGRGFELGLKTIVALLLPIAIVYGVFAPDLIELLYGGGFEGSVTPLRLLAAMTVLYGMTFFVSVVLIARDRPGEFARPAAIVVVQNVIFNFILIPEYGADGAAFNAVLSGLLLAALTVTRTGRSLGELKVVRAAAAPALAGTAMCGVALALAELVPWPLAAVVAGCVYVAAFLGTERLFFKEELAFYRGLVRRRAATPRPDETTIEGSGD